MESEKWIPFRQDQRASLLARSQNLLETFGKINPSQGSRNVGVGAIHLHGNCTRRRRLQLGIDFKWTGCPVSLLSRLPLDRSNSKSRASATMKTSFLVNVRMLPSVHEKRAVSNCFSNTTPSLKKVSMDLASLLNR